MRLLLIIFVIAVLGCQEKLSTIDPPDFAQITTPIKRSAPDPNEVNLLSNASFEMGKQGWVSMMAQNPVAWRDFELSDHSYAGEQSVLLQMDSAEQELGGTRIWGVMQEFPVSKVPRVITGHYYVEDWVKGTAKQYLQAVVLLTIADIQGAAPEIGFDPRHITTQIAWVLGGVAKEPFKIGNRKFIFLNAGEPIQNAWQPFEIDIHQGLAEAWGIDASLVKLFKLRIFFEARYDGFESGDKPVAGKVYFDELSVLGLAATEE